MSAVAQGPDDQVVSQPLPHESAALHVTGRALYTEDLGSRLRGCCTHPSELRTRTPS